MPRNILKLAVFVAGLAAACAIAIGYIGSNVLALCVTILIGACYVAGARELQRFHETTDAFSRALDALQTPPKNLPAWLDTLPPAMRNATRMRLDGARAALPGPALTPYLVGLLVLLGMLGTLLGMVVTLRGTGAALDSATDLAAIRASLAAPVTGLGFAFGTSIAGVATSAMLGLLSALCRRDRMQASHVLDTKIATTLHGFTGAHQREEALRLMQRQADLMPKLADHLHAMMSAIEQQSVAANERQIANQDAFHAKTETAYRRLATSVELSLKQSVADSARAASAALQPVMQASMDGIARETTALHGRVEQAVARQLDGLTSGFETSAAKVAEIWNRSLDAHRESNSAWVEKVDASFDRFAAGLEQRSVALVDGVAVQMNGVRSGLEAHVERMGDSFDKFADKFEQRASSLTDNVAAQMNGVKEGLDAHVEHMSTSFDQFTQSFEQRSSSLTDNIAMQMNGVKTGLDAHVARMGASFEQFADKFEQRSTSLVDNIATQMNGVKTGLDAHVEHMDASFNRFAENFDQRSTSLVDHATTQMHGVTQSTEAIVVRMDASMERFAQHFEVRSAGLVDHVSEAWRGALAQQAHSAEALAAKHEAALRAASAHMSEHAAALLQSIDASHANLRAELAANNDARLTAWTDALGALAQTLRHEWHEANASAAAHQERIGASLERAASEIAATGEAHANATIAQIEELVRAASEAPKAAAEVIAELRQKLSDSMVRDTAMLDERARLLATLETLLDAVNHASTQQRTAVDALVAGSADLLERVGSQFTGKVEAETHKLSGVAAQVAGGAVEVASLSEAFGAAVHAFGASNDTLVAQLQRIEAALDKSLARSDEQLAYYVAQAREVIDLSMMSQKQIVEDLQQIAHQRGAKAA